jgi:hypothetical protein
VRIEFIVHGETQPGAFRMSRTVSAISIALVGLAWTPSCIRLGAFVCGSDDDCTRLPGGVCFDDACGYPDPECVPSGYRYSEHAAASRANRCVDDEDAGTGGESTGGSASETDTETGTHGCDEVDCSGHGTCVMLDDAPVCHCDSGHYAAGNTCLQDPCSTHACLFVDAVTGDDDHPGTREEPFASVARALGMVDADAAGVAVVLRRGRIWAENLLVADRVGRSDAPFILGAYGPVDEPRPVVRRVTIRNVGHVVMRDLESTPLEDDESSGPCVQVSKSDYVTLYDNRVRGCATRGIRFHDDVSHGAIVGNLVVDVATQSGISVADASWAEPEPTFVSDHHYIVDNTLVGPFSREAGIHVNATAAGDIKVIGNRVAGSPDSHGIRVTAATVAWILGNTVVTSSFEDNTHPIFVSGGRFFVEGNVTYANGRSVRLAGTSTLERNTLLETASATEVDVASIAAQIRHNLMLGTSGPNIRYLEPPEVVLLEADHNWYGQVGAGSDVCTIQVSGQGSVPLEEWQLQYDMNSRCGPVPGLGPMLGSTHPSQWDEQWNQVVPEGGWAGCDEATTPGAFDCTGDRVVPRLSAEPELADGDGLGWSPPLAVRLRYPQLVD